MKGKKRKPFSDEHRRKLSESLKGENHPLFGKTPSAETRKKISESLKGRSTGPKGKSWKLVDGKRIYSE